MVDSPGYSKSQVGDQACFEICDMGAKYFKEGSSPPMSVLVEIYLQSDQSAAEAWVKTIKFGNTTESRNWELTTFKGYPASQKAVEFTVTDRKNEEVFMRVAVGNVGVLAKFTQTTTMGGKLTPLDEAKASVEEVTAAIVSALETG